MTKMNKCTVKPLQLSADSNTTDEEFVEEIVIKLRKIGDEFNENAPFKMELSHMMKDCIKTVLFKRMKDKLGDVTSVTKWLE